MSVPADHLDKETHARILQSKILPNSGINEATSQAHPKFPENEPAPFFTLPRKVSEINLIL
ncbi:hypothetical protein [Lysobacter sp. Hz 25]|uniref:hypothetical protein n=1 Tax=Lysobacter sp. Hz 25 TaxID=3383698 RepID=UPI0038D44AC6